MRAEKLARKRADKASAVPALAVAVVVAFAGLAFAGLGARAASPATVSSDAGNIFIERDGVRKKLTASEMDVDPTLSPDGTIVVYTRQGRGRAPRGSDLDQRCTSDPRPDELRQVNADGTGDKLLLSGREGSAQQQLCDFRGKQFSSDGRRLYFLTPGGSFSGALHVYDMRSREARYLLPANDLVVLNFCTGKYKDALAVLMRRAFLFDGTYVWYWLYDAAGKKEYGPLGPFLDPDELIRQMHSTWCEGKS